MLPALYLATLLVFAISVLPLWQNPHWLIRAMDFPRLQLAGFALALLVVQLVTLDFERGSDRLAMFTVTACLAWHLWRIAPYTPLWPPEVPPAPESRQERQLSIITANVLTPNRNAQALLALVAQHQPDILLTLESDLWWQNRLDALEADMPYTVKCPQDNLYGMHVYSRLPLRETEVSFLVEDDVPSIHALLTLRSGHTVCMHFLHPAPPSPTEKTESKQRDAELVMVARSIANTDQAVIVAWSPTTRLFRRLSGLLDPRVGRGMFNTFHADHWFMRWPLDYLFHSQHFSVLSLARLPSIGSDHFPLLTRLSYSADDTADHAGLTSAADDQQRAQAIVDGEDVSESDVPRPGQ